MKLHRVASINLDKAPGPAHRLGARVNGVDVVARAATMGGEPCNRIAVTATVELSQTASVDAEGYVRVSEADRRRCDYAIEHIADLMSVFGRTPRTVSAVHPCIALSDVSDDELSLLNGSLGFKSPPPRVTASGAIDLSDVNLLNSMHDRHVGVKMLAQAVSASTPAGKYLELIRFIEHAFAMSKWQLRGKLTQFLSSGQMGYSRDEVEGWLVLRDGYFHADEDSVPRVATSDIQRVIPRMEQAAYDILFNKTAWHDKSKERRTVYTPPVGTVDAEAVTAFLTRGQAMDATMQLLDPCGAFPMDLGARLTTVPEGWWWRSPRQDSQVPLRYSGMIEVRNADGSRPLPSEPPE